ncbi:MAG TPA: hypothetical protein VMW75_19825, partial [Thermoanaerobaculia bacterium]|nr:hypothetical protein [Thermoanaerobaculia bacterium]
DSALASWAPRLERDSARVDWSRPAADLVNRWRAYTPWPGLTAELRGAPVKLLQIAGAPADPPAGAAAAPAAGAPPPPGTFLGSTPAGLAVACGGGTALAIVELQRPGRKAQPARDFVNGERLRPGERFS